VLEFFHEECVFDTPRGSAPGGTHLVGKDQVRQGIEARFAGIPDIRYGHDRHWVSGDRGASEWTITGTDTDGSAVEVRGCDLFEFRDGKISRKDSYWKIVE
jgi:ketosteroid isomerase-like protein